MFRETSTSGKTSASFTIGGPQLIELFGYMECQAWGRWVGTNGNIENLLTLNCNSHYYKSNKYDPFHIRLRAGDMECCPVLASLQSVFFSNSRDLRI